MERKLSFQESLFTAVSSEIKLTSYVQIVVEEIIFQLHGSIFTVLGHSLEKNCNEFCICSFSARFSGCLAHMIRNIFSWNVFL